MIGNKIAAARKKTNISQAQLAERLFISPQAVGKWERGESMPDITTFNSLAEILGVDLNYFSENFQSEASEEASAGPGVKQAGETPAGKQDKKLSWNMSLGNWQDADFSGLKNLHEKFSGSNMQRCKFAGSDLSGLLLKGNNIETCDFSGSDFSKSHIQTTNINNSVFKDVSLEDTEFSESFITGCDFTNADLTGVEAKSGGFEKNTVTNAVWNRTSFKAMYIADILFEGTVGDCYFEDCTFKRVTFQNTTLTNTFFKGNSLKQIRFVDCQADRITYEFLKNGKADVTGISVVSQ